MTTKTVGVKDFKNRATQLLRFVREQKTEVIVTHDGKPVAVLRPFGEKDDVKNRSLRLKAAMDRADDLAVKLDAVWPEGLTAAEAVSKQRR